MISGETALAEEFERQRPRLTAVAARVLGSQEDAEDAVQEAWLRLTRQDASAIENLSAWLTTIVSRVSIDLLRARRARPENYGDQPAEWAVTEDDSESPEGEAVLAESVGLALLTVLDRLGSDERLAFVLHDVFAVPFHEIGQILGKSTDAAKMLASRARRRVQGAPEPRDRRRQREVVDAFLAAAERGDFEGLLRVLDPKVVWRVHSARGEVIRIGATELASQAVLGGRSAKVVARRVLVDGEPGIAAWRENGQPLAVMACTVAGDRIVTVESVTDPEKLAAMGVAALAPGG